MLKRHDGSVSGRRAYWAVVALFAAMGIAFASWASRLVAVRGALAVSPGTMGWILLSWSVGAIITMPLSGWLISRLGLRSTLGAFTMLAMVGFAGAGISAEAGQPVLVALSLLMLGIGNGTWDVAMNLAGTRVEHLIGRPVLPHFHAAFSVGTIFAASLGALAARTGLPLLLHFGIVTGLTVILVLWGVAGTLPEPEQAERGSAAANAGGQRFGAAWTEKRTLLLGVMVAASGLTEGAANDWLASGLVEGFAVSESVGIIGLNCFLVAMTVGRMAGERAIRQLGRVLAVRLSALAMVLGMLAYCLTPWLAVALLGALLWGLGTSLGFPIGLSAAADDPLRAAQRTSVVVTIAYTGFLVGPPLIGWLADLWGFRLALLIIFLPAVISVVLAPNATRQSV